MPTQDICLHITHGYTQFAGDKSAETSRIKDTCHTDDAVAREVRRDGLLEAALDAQDDDVARPQVSLHGHEMRQLVLASAIVQLASPWQQPPPPVARRLRLRYA